MLDCYLLICWFMIVTNALQGNEDAGQMSAWLVMSALGFYQVCPGCGTGIAGSGGSGDGGGGGEYVLTTPLFDDITIALPIRSVTAPSAGEEPLCVSYRFYSF
jgi:putative alpha-1,2-mannosidase